MAWMIPAAIIGSSLLGSRSSSQAASTQAAAAGQAADMQLQMFREQAALQEPFRQAGVRALPQLEKQRNMMPAAFTSLGNMPKAFTGQVKLGEDPGYAFRLSEGQKALDRQAAARGGLISGGALKAAQRYGQEMGSQEYGNAYNRALTNYNAAVSSEGALYNRALTNYNAAVAREATGYNRLASLAGIGQTATSQIGAVGQNTAANIGNLMTSGAAAQAAGQVGAANALTGGLSTYLNYNQGNNLVNALNYGRLAGQYGAGNVYMPGGGGASVPSSYSGSLFD
jgi:hypothetical protein